LYGTLISAPNFIKLGAKSSDVTYKKLGEAALPAARVPMLVYAPFLTKEKVALTYRLDGKWIGVSSLPPYRGVFDFSAEADGTHTFTIIVNAPDGSVLRTLAYTVTKKGTDVVIHAPAD
jgi:hypothetical protein